MVALRWHRLEIGWPRNACVQRILVRNRLNGNNMPVITDNIPATFRFCRG